jgi:hypothetical protein
MRRIGAFALFFAAALVAAPIGGAATGTVAPPPVNALFSYQIGGAFTPLPGIGIVDRDRHDRPAAGLYNVCYVNAFQSQADEHRWWLRRHRSLLLFRKGRAVVDGQWNEQLLDTSTRAKRRALAGVIGTWMAGCARAGFNAVEPDNLDSWSRSDGALSVHDNLAFAAALVRRAHALGLAIAQKNAAEISATGRRIGFDFAIAEECQAYSECGSYTRVYGDHVIEIEYPDNGGVKGFDAACKARGAQISVVYRDRDVLPAGQRGHVERHCG